MGFSMLVVYVLVCVIISLVGVLLVWSLVLFSAIARDADDYVVSFVVCGNPFFKSCSSRLVVVDFDEVAVVVVLICIV